jgi:hypothetical protein
MRFNTIEEEIEELESFQSDLMEEYNLDENDFNTAYRYIKDNARQFSLEEYGKALTYKMLDYIEGVDNLSQEMEYLVDRMDSLRGY